MKRYDLIIGLGQWCACSEALRECHLQNASFPFDWSGGILTDICGKGGLSGKINLLCNNFENYLNLTDLENRGPNKDGDSTHFWIVNLRTGLQYKHDFPVDKKIEDVYTEVKEKYDRRVNRLYQRIDESRSILFVFISDEGDYSADYFVEQKLKIQKRFPSKEIDFLYITHVELPPKEYRQKKIDKNITWIELNYKFSNHSESERWKGNFDLYYPILKNFCYTPYTEEFYRNNPQELTEIKSNFNTD